MPTPEHHRMGRVRWLRAAVLGANDGIVSTASLVVGVPRPRRGAASVLVAGVAGLVAGAMSMAAGEYVSVSSQADTEQADLERETRRTRGRAERSARSSPRSTSRAGPRAGAGADRWPTSSWRTTRSAPMRATSSASPKSRRAADPGRARLGRDLRGRRARCRSLTVRFARATTSRWSWPPCRSSASRSGRAGGAAGGAAVGRRRPRDLLGRVRDGGDGRRRRAVRNHGRLNEASALTARGSRHRPDSTSRRRSSLARCSARRRVPRPPRNGRASRSDGAQSAFRSCPSTAR